MLVSYVIKHVHLPCILPATFNVFNISPSWIISLSANGSAALQQLEIKMASTNDLSASLPHIDRKQRALLTLWSFEGDFRA